MQIFTMNRDEAENYEPTSDHEVCISISSVGAPPPRLSDRFEAVLSLSFDDVDMEDRLSQRFQPFNRLTAQQVQAFIHQHATADRLIVHCEAGVSRSVSMAAAIADHFNYRAPNRLVYSLVADALHAARNTMPSLGGVSDPRPWRRA